MLCTHAIELILMLLMFDYQGILHNLSKKHQTRSRWMKGVCPKGKKTSWISLDDAVKPLGRRWKKCFVCEAPVFVS